MIRKHKVVATVKNTGVDNNVIPGIRDFVGLEFNDDVDESDDGDSYHPPEAVQPVSGSMNAVYPPTPPSSRFPPSGYGALTASAQPGLPPTVPNGPRASFSANVPGLPPRPAGLP